MKILKILRNKKYTLLFVLFFYLFFTLFVLIPTWLIPGNDLFFQFSTYNFWDYFLLFILAFLSALILTLNLFLKKKKTCHLARDTAGTFGAGLSATLASVIGTSACAGCISTFIIFFGLGFSALNFILDNQIYFSLSAILLNLIILYFLYKKI